MDAEPNSSPQRSQRVSGGRNSCRIASPKSMLIFVDGTGRSVVVRHLLPGSISPDPTSSRFSAGVVVEVDSFPWLLGSAFEKGILVVGLLSMTCGEKPRRSQLD